MQGQQSAIGSLPEVIGFDHGSTSSDTGFDHQMCWTSIGSSSQSWLPDYVLSSSDANMGPLNAVNHPRQDFCGWDFGESSSRTGVDEISENDQKSKHQWSAPMSVCAGSMLISEQQYQSSNSNDENQTQLIHNSVCHQSQQDLNMNYEVDEDDEEEDDDEDDDDDCQVLDYPHVFKSGGSRHEQMPFASSSSNPFGAPTGNGGYLVEEGDGGPGCSLAGRRLSCKRKTLEGNAGQPSEGGVTTNVQRAESSLWHTLPAWHNASSSSTLAGPEENNLNFNLPEQVNPRLGLSFGQVASDNSHLSDALGTAGSSRGNFRLRINAAYQQGSVPDSMYTLDTNTGNVNIHSSHHSLRLHAPSNLLDLRSGSVPGNGSAEGQSVAVHVSPSHWSSQSRWNGSASLRNGTSSSSIGSGVRNAVQNEASSSTSMQSSIADFPMFVPPNERGSSSQSAPNWGLAGGDANVSGNVASSSWSTSGAGIHSAAASLVTHQSPSHYPRRPAEYIRRSLAAATESGGQNGIYLRSGPSSQEIQRSSGSSSQGRPLRSRSVMLLERRIDGAFGIPHSLRTSAMISEGRSRLVSEMRNVLDLVRRGEGLRFEDVMVLDQSGFFGMADIHDRHRDMRLDVDNMSYEELLALEERIGNVSTGLSEESILKQLKKQNYVGSKVDEEEIEPCCICQEEYNEGEVLGSLECGHDFHAECIKQWLMHKNLCPICKTTGLTK